jgi:phage-related protein
MAKKPEPENPNPQPKPVRWVGSSKDDLSAFPLDVKRRVGGALYEAQTGGKATYAKVMKGYKGAKVLEIVDDFNTDTFRAVYTVSYPEFVFVLHAFEKKSKSGIATPKADLKKIETRLKRAREEYEQWQTENQKQKKESP